MKYIWIFLGVVLVGSVIFWSMQTVEVKPQQFSDYKTITLTMGSEQFITQIADTPALQEQGLSGRQGIGKNEAMLFVFLKAGVYRFWMKDMNFPIDIVWLDASKKIIYIEKNVDPSTYPRAFGPSSDSRYVIEVVAGTTDRIGVSVGQNLSF